jgi:uncharacterized protein YprB with RNaseH-like and TPR domain
VEARTRPITFKRDRPRIGSQARPDVAKGRIVPLDGAVAGVERTSAAGATWLLVEESVVDRDPSGAELCGGLRSCLADRDGPIRRRLGEIHEPFAGDPAELVFVDLETTGLSSSPVFLIGAMAWCGDGLVIRQFFARDYAEERGILSAYADWAAERPVWVTFNGKSFDWPYLRARAAACGVPMPEPRAHLDLLHESRRRWGKALPDCRLQTLETRICGRRRFGDIPGQAIPDAYHRFVRTGHAAEMAEVLKHNLLDLLTLADLMVRWSQEPG